MTLKLIPTNVEAAAPKPRIPMRTHLAVDALAGVAVAAAPWVTGRRKQGIRHWLPYALVGVGELGMALMTRRERPRRGLRRLLRHA